MFCSTKIKEFFTLYRLSVIYFSLYASTAIKCKKIPLLPFSSVRHILRLEFSQKSQKNCLTVYNTKQKRVRKLERRSDHGREPPRAFVRRCRADSTRGIRCRVAARIPCRCHCHGSLSPSAWAARSCSCARDAASSCSKLCCRLASRKVSASSRGEAARSCSSDRAVSRWAARKSSDG